MINIENMKEGGRVMRFTLIITIAKLNNGNKSTAVHEL